MAKYLLLKHYRGAPASVNDPLLWIADAVDWCSSAGGAWRDRVAPIIAATQDVPCP